MDSTWPLGAPIMDSTWSLGTPIKAPRGRSARCGPAPPINAGA